MKQAKDTEPVQLVRYITSNGPLRADDEFDDEDNEGDYYDPDSEDDIPEGDD